MSHVGWRTGRWSSWAWRLTALGFVWLALSAGETSSWLLGAPAVVLGAVLITGKTTQHGFRLFPFSRLVARLGKESVIGGTRIAWSATRVKQPVATGFTSLETQSTNEQQRAWLIAALGAVPGTLCVDAVGPMLTIHLMVETDEPNEQARQLESCIEAAFPDERGDLIK